MTKSISNLLSSSRSQAVGTLAGIDIGKHIAKLVVVRRQTQEVSVTRASCLQIPSDLQGDGAELAKLLCKWLRENTDSGCRDFVGSLPSSMVDYETIEIPSGEPIDLAEFAEATMGELLGSDRNLTTHDYWKNSRNVDSNTLNLAWTSSKFASELTTGLSYGGWRCLALDIPAQTLARVSSLGEISRKHSIVVDIGAGEVSIVFTDNGNSEYFRNRIRFSPDSASETLAEALGVTKDAAENLLVHWGLGRVGSSEPIQLEKLIAQHLTQWLEQLVYELRRTLNFFKHRFGADSACELLLCGGGANIRGLPEALTTELSNVVRLAVPAGAWSWKSAERYSPIYAQAVCLAMYGAAT